jgi:hypothetical protein
MNMGLWPAETIRKAQESLIGVALARASASWARVAGGAAPKGIVDLGSGWGGSRSLFHTAFPQTPYFGVNVSTEQVRAARQATAHIPETHYIETSVENVSALPFDRADLLFSIEAAFHFENKAAILREAASRGVGVVTWLEICVENARLLDSPLIAPSLRHAWSTQQYQQAFEEAGFGKLAVEDLTARVLPGFFMFLDQFFRCPDESAPYGGRRAVFDQVLRATEVLVAAAERGEVRYLLLAG